MTEQQWLTTTNLQAMLLAVAAKTSMRKGRLFAVACCHRVWHLLKDQRSREAVELVERLAEGQALETEWASALGEMDDAVDDIPGRDPDWERRADHFANVAACWTVRSHPDHVMGAYWGAVEAAGRLALASAPDGADLRAVRVAAEEEEEHQQLDLLRDILGNPFRPVRIDPSWQTPVVVGLAQAAYEHRGLDAPMCPWNLDNDRLGILADALEDVGCENAELLMHLRDAGVHVRGCHVLDALLGKAEVCDRPSIPG